MKTTYVNSDFESSIDRTEEIHQSLQKIEERLTAEIRAKQLTIERQEEEIRKLHLMIEEKSQNVIEINRKLTDCQQNNEGHRQLINKLLGDIDRLNHDVEWYKKTYVKRSLLGTIKEKLFKKW